MFVPDMPNVPDQYLPVMFAENRIDVAPSVTKSLTIGVCQPVPNIPGMSIGWEHGLTPVPAVVNYLWRFDEHFKKMPEDQRRATLALLENSAKVTILQQPKYGTLTESAKPAFQDPINGLFYNPKSGYMGKDQVVFLVEMGEYKIKVMNNLYPVASSPDGTDTLERVCGKRGVYYRISSASEQLSSWILASQLDAKLASFSGISVSIEPLVQKNGVRGLQ